MWRCARMITDKLGEELELLDVHGGKGMILAYPFFGGEIAQSMTFFSLAFEPGVYFGYHLHEKHEEVVYILSGTVEAFEEGERRNLVPGDAILLKPGKAHAFRAVGDEPVKVVGFVAMPAEEQPVATTMPLPSALSDW